MREIKYRCKPICKAYHEPKKHIKETHPSEPQNNPSIELRFHIRSAYREPCDTLLNRDNQVCLKDSLNKL